MTNRSLEITLVSHKYFINTMGHWHPSYLLLEGATVLFVAGLVVGGVVASPVLIPAGLIYGGYRVAKHFKDQKVEESESEDNHRSVSVDTEKKIDEA